MTDYTCQINEYRSTDETRVESKDGAKKSRARKNLNELQFAFRGHGGILLLLWFYTAIRSRITRSWLKDWWKMWLKHACRPSGFVKPSARLYYSLSRHQNPHLNWATLHKVASWESSLLGAEGHKTEDCWSALCKGTKCNLGLKSHQNSLLLKGRWLIADTLKCLPSDHWCCQNPGCQVWGK